MQCGEIVGIRGPFGRGFPIDKMRGHDVLLVAGGLGIAPLRSLINNIHDERSEFGKVTIIYGSKNPSEVMFRNQFEMWKHRRDFELHLTVDNADEGWDGEVAVSYTHLDVYKRQLWASGRTMKKPRGGGACALEMVPSTGFEPAAPCSGGKCSIP